MAALVGPSGSLRHSTLRSVLTSRLLAHGHQWSDAGSAKPAGHTRRVSRLVVLVLVAACAPPRAPAVADAARVVIDYAGIDAWLACVRAGADRPACAAASAATPGGRLAEAAVATFGDAGEMPAPAVDEVAAVVVAMKAWPDALSRAVRFVPAPVDGGPIRVFVVGNGHPQGDAYAQAFDAAGRPAERGEPVVLLAPVLIAAGYTGGPAARADKAFGVLAHELFHVLFRRYLGRDPAWAALAGDPQPRTRLEVLVLNEGIAHFIAREAELVRDGFPAEHAAGSFDALALAWERIDGPDGAAVVRAASQGSYWNKFGSIAGMALAYGVFRDRGAAGLVEAVRCGPGRLVTLYAAAVARHPELRPPPPLTASWLDVCRRG